jgi:LPS export ABC transporter permease LptG/LPS export ABC transporter permease LptF
MSILSRTIFREVASSALLGAVLWTFVLFLQRVGRLFEILVRSSASFRTVGELFALATPFTLSFSVPLGVLIGVLIALSRMSSDGEITAMRAAGVSSRKVVAPVLTLAFLGMLITATSSLWLTPYSISATYRILNKLVAEELTAEVHPRIFEEQFPNTVLYVGDVIQGPVTRWRNVFMADIRPASERHSSGSEERGDSPRVTVASNAIAIPDVVHNRIQLSMLNGGTHEVGKDITRYFSTSFPKGDQLLEATKPNAVRPTKEYTELDTFPLYKVAYRDPNLEQSKRIAARIELHQRFALPPACILLALIGIPLGVSSRKGGKSSAVVLTALLAFLYWMGLIAANALARQEKLPVGTAVWIPNMAFAVIGIMLLVRMETPGHHDWVGLIREAIVTGWQRLRGTLPIGPGMRPRRSWRFPLVPQVIDRYVLTSFLFYFVVLLASFVLMIYVYTFFELLSDIVKNKIPMSRVLTYLVFLTPKLIYDYTPISVLVSILVTFGVLTKHNEVIAFKATGVSLYRLAAPVLLASIFLSASLFAFDHYYVPQANRIQDAIRNEIKGRPVQTYLRPDRKWIFGLGSWIYYYKYFDPGEKVMFGVNVYELDPASFRVVRHISAERARWERTLHKWVFENGWSRDFTAKGELFKDFSGQATTFQELNEPPDYFLKEVLQDKQMNFQQLATYIRELQQSGFDTVALQVQFYKKFAVPLFAIIMALIAIPFAFLVGNRGAMAGVGISFGIAIAYVAINLLSEQIGDVNLLPAAVAAWSPDTVFTLAGLYFFSRMRT